MAILIGAPEKST